MPRGQKRYSLHGRDFVSWVLHKDARWPAELLLDDGCSQQQRAAAQQHDNLLYALGATSDSPYCMKYVLVGWPLLTLHAMATSHLLLGS